MIKTINDTVHGESRTEQTSRQIMSDVVNCEKLRLTPIPRLDCVQLPYHGNDNGQVRPNLSRKYEIGLKITYSYITFRNLKG